MLPMHFCWSPCLAKPWAHGASSISDITMFLSVNLENLSRAELSHWNSSLASLTQRDRFSLLCTSWGGFFFFFNYAEQVNHFLPLMYLPDFLKIKETKQPGETNCTCQPVGPLWNSVLEGTFFRTASWSSQGIHVNVPNDLSALSSIGRATLGEPSRKGDGRNVNLPL